jgi:hypothetical protein
MITIISKRKIGFFNPRVNILETGIGPNSPKYNEAIFETNGTGELQKAPDWINRPLGVRGKLKAADPDVDINAQNMNTWRLAASDGHVMEVKVQTSGEPSELEMLAASKSAQQAAKVAAQADKPLPEVKTADELNGLNKTQLLEHAAAKHDIQLSTGTPKAEIVAAILNAQAELAKAVGGFDDSEAADQETRDEEAEDEARDAVREAKH